MYRIRNSNTSSFLFGGSRRTDLEWSRVLPFIVGSPLFVLRLRSVLLHERILKATLHDNLNKILKLLGPRVYLPKDGK